MRSLDQTASADIGGRLKEERGRLGYDQRSFASLAGINKNTQLAYEKGDTSPTADYLTNIAQAGADAAYILTGIRRSSGAAASDDLDEVQIDSIDLSYGLGGTFVDVEPGSIEIEKAKFSRNWLRKFTHSPPEMLFTTSGIGDSMRPTIEDADVVVVDRSENLRDSLGEKIWAVVFGGVGMIKRLRPMPDGTVKIMSDNRVVPDDVATDGDLHVVGRVVAVVRRQ